MNAATFGGSGFAGGYTTYAAPPAARYSGRTRVMVPAASSTLEAGAAHYTFDVVL